MGRKRSEKHTALYGIYDIKDNYICVGVFNSDEAAAYLGITYNHLFKCIKYKGVINGRYTVERIEKAK